MTATTGLHARSRRISCWASRARSAALLLGLCLLPHVAQAACAVTKRTSVPFTRRNGLLMVDVTVNGTAVRFQLDTGAERSVLSVAAADRLHLRRDEWVSTDIEGVGGRDRRRLGRPDSLLLAGLPLWRHTLVADDSLVVGPLPDGVDGLLGQDYLSPYDLELDPASSTVSLYAVAGCSGHFLPWSARYEATPLWRPVRNVLATPLRLEGKAIWAELDTGSQRSLITLPGMITLGLQAGGADTLRGFGPATMAARSQDFPSVQIGFLPAAPMSLEIAPVRTFRSLGALLGADWLGSHHVWISWATDQLFVAQ
jgi:hypothetical protein